MENLTIPEERKVIIQKRVKFFVLIIIVFFGFLGYRAAVATMGIENVTNTNLMLVTRTPNSLIK